MYTKSRWSKRRATSGRMRANLRERERERERERGDEACGTHIR
jgi:hypothetical protein